LRKLKQTPCQSKPFTTAVEEDPNAQRNQWVASEKLQKIFTAPFSLSNVAIFNRCGKRLDVKAVFSGAAISGASLISGFITASAMYGNYTDACSKPVYSCRNRFHG
jgi:hypothetical protein